MAISLATKVGAAGSVAVGGGAAGVYLARDYINYYEVERKVMNGEGFLEVSNSSSNWTIKTKEKDNWKSDENGKYYWECMISEIKVSDLKAIDFETRISSAFKLDTKEARQRLVYLCSSDRGEKPISNQIKSQLKAPADLTDKDKLFDHLFGPSILKKVEREVIEKDLKLNVSFDGTSDLKKVTITAPTTASQDNPKLDSGHTWTCEITKDKDSAEDVSETIKTDLSSHLFKDNQALTPEQKKAKAELVKACSESRTTSPNENQVAGSLKIKKEKSGPAFSFVGHSDLDYLLKTKK